ncbi:CU044_5270 family protein [Actinoplanes flavus]|uniref:CU044_5270 family protein n=1 Tax=Actinoplanes flavus TaxID=2820290 RepID=A0ABS3UWJ8_9ACTN|nr:CU044_5270 family protein [Actinoplanes flavus]MBO3742948.1 CU044_5270 family protein [Actinoplanes flavus]
MSKQTDVMKTLADARPARLDPSGTPPLSFAPHAVPVAAARPRQFRAAALIPAGALAAAAVAAVAVVVVNGDAAPVPPESGSSVQATGRLTGSQILLAAAERSGKEAPGSGRYLLFRHENGSVLTVGSGAATFRMTAKSSSETWLARAGDEPTRVVSQPLGLTPLTPADEAAWRAAGSPATVSVGKPLPNGEVGPGSPVATGAGPRTVSTSDADVYAFLPVRDLEKLPTEPAALRAALLKQFDGGGGDMPTDRDQWLLNVASGLITEVPVSGPVRAAAFRLIADLPGTRSLGVVADQHGRTGEGFAFTAQSAFTGAIERRFIIDTATGRALGQESRVEKPGGTTSRLRPGDLVGYSVVLEQTTTDAAPPKK